MPDFTLPRSERLRSLKAIRRMFGEGRSGFVYPFRYTFLVESVAEVVIDQEEELSDRIVVMFSVPKKFHKRANKRNILKRRTREAYRLSTQRTALRELAQKAGVRIDLAMIYSTKESHSYKTISNAVQRILAQVCEHI